MTQTSGFNLFSTLSSQPFDQWFYLPEIQAALNLLFAFALGGLIGMERTFRGRPAGIRTYALVCLSTSSLIACLVALMPPQSTHFYDAVSRTVQGILTGLGFLGAGIIVRDDLKVRGLTTAASIWLTAVIGIICGLGELSLAFFVAFCSWLILVPFRGIENLIIPKRHRFTQIQIKIEPQSTFQESDLRDLISQHEMSISEIAISKHQGLLIYDLQCSYRHEHSPSSFSKSLLSRSHELVGFHISSSPDEHPHQKSSQQHPLS